MAYAVYKIIQGEKMKKFTTLGLCVLCVVLIISVLVGALCSSEHTCAADRCTVCLLADSFRTALAVLFCTCTILGINVCFGRLECEHSATYAALSTLISLKVKLSD